MDSYFSSAKKRNYNCGQTPTLQIALLVEKLYPQMFMTNSAAEVTTPSEQLPAVHFYWYQNLSSRNKQD